MEVLLEIYKQTTSVENYRIDPKLLKENNFSESQWVKFVDLVNDLELSEVGIGIKLDEISSGRVKLK